MRTTVLLLLVLLTIFLLLDSSDAWRRRRWKSRRSRGRHTIRVGRGRANYHYRGRNWRGRIGYRRGGRISVGYRKGNHRFNGYYNHRNRNWGIGYTWRFGKRRRRELGTSEDAQKMAAVRLRELGQDVAFIKTQLSSFIPNIKHVTLPTHKGPITDKDLAQDILCLVHQLGKALPQLEAFTKKMFTKHSFAYGVKVDANLEKVPGCEAIAAPPKSTHPVLSGGDLTEMKTFVGALILTRLELKAALPQEKPEKTQ